MKRPLGILGPTPFFHPHLNGAINLALPSDILEVIFSNLRDLDLKSIHYVCHYWRDRTICLAKNNILEMKRFINFLTYTYKKPRTTKKYITHQNAFHCQFKELASSLESKTYETSAHQKRLYALETYNHLLENFSTISNFIRLRSKFKMEFFVFLRFCKPDTVEILKNLSYSQVKLGSFEPIFHLVEIQNKMHILDKMTDKQLKSIMIHDLVTDLAYELSEEGDINQRVTSTSPSKVLNPSKAGLIQALNWIIAKESVMDGLYGKDALFSYLAKKLALSQDVYSFLHFSSQIKNDAEYDSTLGCIFMDFLERGLPGPAFFAAMKMVNDKKRISALSKIWPKLKSHSLEKLESTYKTLIVLAARSGLDLDEHRLPLALSFSHSISSLEGLNPSLEILLNQASTHFKLKICDLVLKESPYLDNVILIIEFAKELAGRLHEYPNAYIGLAYDKITKPGISNYGIAIAIERLIEKYCQFSIELDKNLLYHLVAVQLAELGDLDTALQFCKRIDSSERYDSVLQSISGYLAQNGYSNSALYFAEKIYDVAKRNSAYSVIIPLTL